MIELLALDLLRTHLTVELDELGPEFDGRVATVYGRPLDGADPNCSIGVFLRDHKGMDAPQIGSNGEPAWSRFTIMIQTLVKSSEREPGEVWSIQFTKLVRRVLYRDAQLRSQLLALKVGDEPPYDRTLKCGVQGTEYASDAVVGGMAYMSQTEFYLDAEGI